jgi:hypothetical protein
VTSQGIEELVQKVNALPDPESRNVALELVLAIMDLHASGLERALDIIWAREDGQRAIDALGQDPAVSTLLILHDLHPLDLETRARKALERPEFAAANAKVISVVDGVVRVQTDARPQLRQTLEAALTDAAPDAAQVVIEETAGRADFVPLSALVSA